MNIRFLLKEEVGVPRKNWPVNGGIPVGMGKVRSVEELCLKDGHGNLLEADIEVTSRWAADNSVKWVRVAFETDLNPVQEKEFYLSLKNGSGTAVEKNKDIIITESEDTVRIRNKRLEFGLSRKKYRIFDYIKRDGTIIVDNSGKKGFFIIDGKGVSFDSSNCPEARISVEEHGSVRAVIRAEGVHASTGGDRLFDFVVRYFIYAGSDIVQVDYTFINREDKDSVFLSNIGYELEMAGEDYKGAYGYFDGVKVHGGKFALEQDSVIDTSPLGQSCELVQGDGKREKHAFFEKRVHGWIGLNNGRYGLSATIYRLTQNFPKALRYDGRRSLNVDLWFDNSGKKLEFMQGWAKTHRLFFYFYDGNAVDSQSHKIMVGIENPIVIFVPDEYRLTKTVGDFLPYMPVKYPQFEIALRDAFYIWKSRNRPFGMLDYGDFPQLGDDGRQDYMGNNEHDFAHSLLLQYMRTGEREYYHAAEDSVMHTLDIDMAHHSGWSEEIGGVREHGPNHGANFASGPYAHPSHMWLEGLVEYYYMTGDRRVMELSRQIAKCIIRFVDRMVQCPPERSQAWPLIALTSLYEATGDEEIYANCDILASYIVAWDEKHDDLFCSYGFKKCWSGFHVGLLVEGLFKFYHICRDEEKKDKIRKTILKTVDSIINYGMFEEGSFIYFDYPGYRFNRYGGDMLEPFGYAYAMSNDEKYIRTSIRDLFRCHDVIAANLSPYVLKVNDSRQVVTVFGDFIALNWRALFRYMYWADKSGFGKDLL